MSSVKLKFFRKVSQKMSMASTHRADIIFIRYGGFFCMLLFLNHILLGVDYIIFLLAHSLFEKH